MLGLRVAMSDGSDNPLLRVGAISAAAPPQPAALDLAAARGLRRRRARPCGLALRAPEPWRSPSGQPHFAPALTAAMSTAGAPTCALRRIRVSRNGPMISLRIAVLPATKRPAAGALFYLEGGPGGAATAAAIRVNALFAQVQRTRDLVMVDQRGTGGSRRLACPNGYVRGTDATAVTAYLRGVSPGSTQIRGSTRRVWPQTTSRSCVARWDTGGSISSAARTAPRSLRRTYADTPSPYAASFSTASRSRMSGSTTSPHATQNGLSRRNSRAARLRPPAHAPIRIRGDSSTNCSHAHRAASPSPTARCCSARTTSPGRWTGYPRPPRTPRSFRSR